MPSIVLHAVLPGPLAWSRPAPAWRYRHGRWVGRVHGLVCQLLHMSRGWYGSAFACGGSETNRGCRRGGSLATAGRAA